MLVDVPELDHVGAERTRRRALRRASSLHGVNDPFGPLRARLDATHGVTGVVVAGVDGRPLFEQRAGEEFPAASVVKLPLVMTLHADAAEGRLRLDAPLEVGERVPGSGVLRLLRDVGPLTLRDLAMLAMSVSDNTATNLLIDAVGTARVRARLAEWGCRRARLERKMYDLGAKARGLENVMTPAETAGLLLRVLRGELVDRDTSDAVLALLDANQDATLLGRYLPEGTRLAHKSGWVEGVRNDAGIVWGERPVAVVVFARETTPDVARVTLGLAGWCAFRAAGGNVPALPPELASPA